MMLLKSVFTNSNGLHKENISGQENSSIDDKLHPKKKDTERHAKQGIFLLGM